MLFELIITVCVAAHDGNEICDSAIVDAAPTLQQCLSAMDANRVNNRNRYLSCGAVPSYLINIYPTCETPAQIIQRLGDALEADLISYRDVN